MGQKVNQPLTHEYFAPSPFPARENRLFQGRFEHTVDDKGRLALPSIFRRQLGSEDREDLAVTITVADGCLALYPELEWRRKVELISKLPQLNPNVTAFKRLFIGSAHECTIDKAGRVLLPMDLRNHAQINRDCVVVGQLEKIELWAAERWKPCFAQLTDQVHHVNASLAEFGIPI